MARKKTGKNSEKWKKTLAEEVRPPAEDRMLVSGEVPAMEFANEISPWERIAISIEKLAEALAPKPAIEPALPKWVSPAEAAKVMRLNAQTVMEWCREGRLTASKVGRKWLIPLDAVTAEVRRQQVIGGK